MKNILLILVLISASFAFASEKNLKKIFSDGSLKKKDNLTMASYNFFANKRNVFYVWASWCPACKNSASRFLEANKKIQECRGISVAMISTDKEQGEAEKAISEWGFKEFTVFRDDKDVIKNNIEGGVPKVIITDDNGQVLDVQVGMSNIEKALKRLREAAAADRDCRS